MRKILLALLTLLPMALFADFNITLTTETHGSDIVFFAESTYPVRAYIDLSFPVLKGMTASKPLPVIETVDPGVKTELVTLSVKPGVKTYSYNISYIHDIGDPFHTVPDKDYAYLLPWEHGQKHSVTQGYHGKATHTGYNEYAIDFDLDEGTPVTAARGGMVVGVKEDSNRGGFSSSYGEDANYVRIFHDDGTIASYVHLKLNGALVEVGDKVEAGQVIGLSGNTGISSGPHLHFDVRVPTLDGLETIPTKFLVDGKPQDLVTGNYYYSFHPGMPEFKEVFGADITPDDYKGYSKKIEKSDQIEVRTEKIDDTIIYFIQNGLNVEIEATLSIQYQNMSFSRKLPIVVRIPPLTEVFATIGRSADKEMGFSYNANISATYWD